MVPIMQSDSRNQTSKSINGDFFRQDAKFQYLIVVIVEDGVWEGIRYTRVSSPL